MERLDMDQFDTVYARMLFISRRRTQSELAELLNLQQGSISEAKKRGCIPLPWVVRFSDLFNVRMDWLRFGEPPVFMSSEQQGYESGEAVSTLREPASPPLNDGSPGELPVHSTVMAQDGTFPEVGVQVFPLEFIRQCVEVFRVLDHSMIPVLNAGALVAVARDKTAENGSLVAVLSTGSLQFRRVFRTEAGYELRTERTGDQVRLVAEADWPVVYYGKAIWAFQPL